MSGPTEQDAVRDAYVASLERALRDISAFGVSIERAREIAAEALGTGEVTRIPDGVRLYPREVKFSRWPTPGGEWHLVGPADRLVTGTVIELTRFNGLHGRTESALVAVGFIVAERTVIHRDAGPTRYVMARISTAVKEED